MDFKFNGKDAPNWLIIEDSFKLPNFHVKNDYIKKENVNGAIYNSFSVDALEFKLPLIIRNHFVKRSTDEVREFISDFFYSESEAFLEFSFTNKKLLCSIDGPFELKQNIYGFEIIELTVKSSRWYYELNGEPNKDNFMNGQLTTFNAGIKTPPVQYIKVKEDATILSINNETTGKSVVFGKEVSDANMLLQRNMGVLNAYASDIFNGWPNIAEKTALPVVGTAKGKYTSKDNVMFVDTFGDRIGMSDWFGPAKYKQLDQRVSGNWEFECRIITPPSKNLEMGRKQFILLDELKKPVAVIEARNQSTMNNSIEVIMTLYNENKSKQVLYYENAGWRQQGLVLKLTKTENKYTAYVGVDYNVITGMRYSTHTGRYIRTFDDYAGDYKRALVFVQTQDLRAPNYDPMKFNTSYAKVQQLAVESESPYIFSAGDELVIDHDKHLLTINGEPKYHKSLKSDYFEIVQGENIITVNPPSIIESGYQAYRERYL
ncbi:hypothetical protein ERX27_07440 [Macrococcus brunensis]|uniref:Siphovirus-type tail component C-terminal domain-containing protein n=1 Tax=Macrococcus brunensis TaxID=198483 RepID=A0A4R6BCU4_9STAP|nr:phage tail domain-containing protein [Macrococcus brunensis]TDL96680.1 hypothetical protein ERX27_07440 [Macrococcus brunensis]